MVSSMLINIPILFYATISIFLYWTIQAIVENSTYNNATALMQAVSEDAATKAAAAAAMQSPTLGSSGMEENEFDVFDDMTITGAAAAAAAETILHQQRQQQHIHDEYYSDSITIHFTTGSKWNIMNYILIRIFKYWYWLSVSYPLISTLLSFLVVVILLFPHSTVFLAWTSDYVPRRKLQLRMQSLYETAVQNNNNDTNKPKSKKKKNTNNTNTKDNTTTPLVGFGNDTTATVAAFVDRNAIPTVYGYQHFLPDSAHEHPGSYKIFRSYLVQTTKELQLLQQVHGQIEHETATILTKNDNHNNNNNNKHTALATNTTTTNNKNNKNSTTSTSADSTTTPTTITGVASALSSSPLTAPPTAPYVSWMMITGASKGIGRAFSIALARRRHNNSNYGIIVVARQSEKLKLLAKEIEDCYGLKVVTIPCDLSKDGDVHALMKTIERKQLRIELVVANAGIGDRNDFVTLSPTKMNMVLNLNVIGTTKLIHKVAIHMKKHCFANVLCGRDLDSFKIIVVSSIAGCVPGVPSSAVYAATKAYQYSLCASIGIELEMYNIDVHCVLPGAVSHTDFAHSANMNDTPFFQHQTTNFMESIGLTMSPEYVAEDTLDQIFERLPAPSALSSSAPFNFNGSATLTATPIAVLRRLLLGRKSEIIIGPLYNILGRLICNILPRRSTLMICHVSFSDISSSLTEQIRSILTYVEENTNTNDDENANNDTTTTTATTIDASSSSGTTAPMTATKRRSSSTKLIASSSSSSSSSSKNRNKS